MANGQAAAAVAGIGTAEGVAQGRSVTGWGVTLAGSIQIALCRAHHGQLGRTTGRPQ
jgi:hypothetical protein